MSSHQTFFEKHATPISIVVAGALIGAGIWLSQSGSSSPKLSENSVSPEKTINLKKVLKDVNQKDLSSCIANQSTKEKVDRDIQLATDAGMQGTPHMVIMKKDGNKTVFATIPGAQPKEVIEQVITSINDYAVPAIAGQEITAQDRVQGDPETALAIVVEYSDIDCPFCKRLHPTLQSLVDEGKIAWVYRHSPIPQLHPDAYNKAITAECAGNLGGNDAFWSYLESTL